MQKRGHTLGNFLVHLWNGSPYIYQPCLFWEGTRYFTDGEILIAKRGHKLQKRGHNSGNLQVHLWNVSPYIYEPCLFWEGTRYFTDGEMSWSHSTVRSAHTHTQLYRQQLLQALFFLLVQKKYSQQDTRLFLCSICLFGNS